MDHAFIIRAKHVIPRPGEEIEDGAVAVAGHRIAEVGRFSKVNRHADGRRRDLGDAVVIPGLINAHTHLELTDLHGRIEKTDRFLDWLRQIGKVVVRWKLVDRILFLRRGRFYRSTKNGIAKSSAAGTTTVGDISNSGASLDLLRYGPLRSVVFQEVIDLRSRNVRRKVDRVRRRLERRPPTPLMRRGIAPHAPYSASLELYRRSALAASEMNIRLASHVHETLEEIEALEKGTGEFRGVMEYFMRLPADWKPPGRPLACLDALGAITNRTLLAHCNYLNESDMGVLQARKPSVVFCPRSHAYFGHAKHPVRTLLDCGVNVALGTDSLASCDSLSLLDEMRFLVNMRTDISPKEALSMATTNGARALGLATRTGRLERGYEADMTAIRIQGSHPCAHDAILHDRSEAILSIVRGRACGANGFSLL